MSAIGDTISNTVGRYIPFARRKPRIDRKEALAIVPLRNPVVDWERTGSEITLTIPVRNDGLAKVVRKLVRNLPESRKVALDEVGSSVWELCDGHRSISEVISSISKDYKLTRREAEASVTMFLQTLAKKGLIGLMSAGGKKSAKRKH